MDHVIRPVRPDEWRKVKELRLAALADPVAHLAFLDTYEKASVRPDSFWQERTLGGSMEGAGADRQFVAEGPDGEWAGTVVVLVEKAGADDVFGGRIAADQGHLVAVFVRPEHRGTGLTRRLFRAALDWAWSLEEPRLTRVRLFVHEDNARARAFYRKFGFMESGEAAPMPGDPSAKELEMVIVRPATDG
ncbi:GNAT family N-acetyltransferase [Streptomyces sannanensis]|uniref:GNAT family N-acetyltransferase n=1 Tax=Streptomyces sannanensis TaxID=285536 RepID=A0ABP6SBQ3_9ACTN